MMTTKEFFVHLFLCLSLLMGMAFAEAAPLWVYFRENKVKVD